MWVPVLGRVGALGVSMQVRWEHGLRCRLAWDVCDALRHALRGQSSA